MSNENWELISSYSRAQALEDGSLVDVTEVAKKLGFKVPVAVTQAVWVDCCEWSESDERGLGQTTEGRLHDVLMMALRAALAAQGETDRVRFKMLRVPRDAGATTAKGVELVATIGPGDDPSPVVTIGFSDDF